MRAAPRHASFVAPTPRRKPLSLVALRDESGSQLIEMAIGLCIFLFMVFGFINFAMMMYGFAGATFGAKRAVRYACVSGSFTANPATQAQMDSLLVPFVPGYPSRTITTQLNYTNGNVVGSTVSYKATVVYKIVLPGYTLSGIQLSTSASGVITR